MNNTVLKIAFAGLLMTTMVSCKHKTTLHPFIGVWEGTVSSQNYNSTLISSLEFVNIDPVKQEIAAFLLYPVESVDTVKLSGTIKDLQIDLQNENYELYGVVSADSSIYSGKIIRILEKDTLFFTFRNPKFYYSETENDEETDDTPQIPQITKIKKSPDRLTKEVKTYTVTLTTEGKKVKLEDTEFSLDGKNWQKSAEFKDVKGGKYTFYARSKKDKSLQDKKEMYFECFVDVPLPTIPQLNELLKKIADCEDAASDELRKYSKNLPVRGVANINKIEQLVRDACINGTIYVVQKIETDKNGNLAAIIIRKN